MLIPLQNGHVGGPPQGTAQHRAVGGDEGEDQIADAADDVGTVAVIGDDLVGTDGVGVVGDGLGKDEVTEGDDVAGDGHGDGLDKGRKGREAQPEYGVVLDDLGVAGKVDEGEVHGGPGDLPHQIGDKAGAHHAGQHAVLGDELKHLVRVHAAEEVDREHGDKGDGHAAEHGDLDALHPGTGHADDRGDARAQNDADAQGVGHHGGDLFAQAADAQEEEDQCHQKSQGDGSVDALRARGKICHAPCADQRDGRGDPPCRHRVPEADVEVIQEAVDRDHENGQLKGDAQHLLVCGDGAHGDGDQQKTLDRFRPLPPKMIKGNAYFEDACLDMRLFLSVNAMNCHRFISFHILHTKCDPLPLLLIRRAAPG